MSDTEKAFDAMDHLERSRTVGGHANDTSQPSLPVVHRRFANPSPLGLYSFATGIFLLSVFGVSARGVSTPNILVGVLLFFTGFCQYIAGIMEFVAGNTFGATVFNAYASFAFAYAMIYLPGTGIMAAYTEPGQSMPGPAFEQAVSLFLWAWFAVTTAFVVAAIRSSWALLGALVFFWLELLLLACGYMVGSPNLLIAGNSVGFLAALCAYYAACAGLWAGDLTPVRLPTGSLAKKE